MMSLVCLVSHAIPSTIFDFRFPGCVDNAQYDPVFTAIIPSLKQTLYSYSVRSLRSNPIKTSSEMNSQISLAMVFTLCLSNAAVEENITLGMDMLTLGNLQFE